MLNFIQAHETVFALGLFWVASAGVGSMPAPTATSSTFYTWWFKFANTIMANVSRAYGTAVEKSPNFQDAVKLQNSPLKRP
jgi:hypothetical protein